LCAPEVDTTTEESNLANLLDALNPHSGEADGLQRDRKLQTLTFRDKRALRQECIRIRYDDVEYRFRLRMAGPLMNVESQNKRMLLGLTPLTRWWCVSLALLSATVSPAPSFSQGTLEQRLACTPDVLRLCSAFIPNAHEITICLREKNAELSDACRAAIEAGTKQPPDGIEARERTAR
jgi:hypothetical protein